VSARNLDRSSRPLWEQVLDDLRRRLGAGEFGDRFPTDRELVADYGVSRHTVREAVRHLQQEGLVTRRRGKGSFVADAEFEQPLGTLYSLFRSIEAQGVTQTSVVLAQETRIDAEAAKVLELADETPLFYLERIRLADDEPLALDRAWLPLEIAEPLLEVNFTRTALYDELRERCGVGPESGMERIRPIVPGRAEAVKLGIDVGDPAFEIDRRTTCHGRPLEWRITLVRGDRYVFRVDWDSPGHRPQTNLIPDLP